MANLNKFANLILDPYDDPKFVDDWRAQAMFGDELPRPEQLHLQSRNQFAINILDKGEVIPKYPLMTKQAAVLSAVYFAQAEKIMPSHIAKVAGANICNALTRYGVDVPDMLKKYAGMIADRQVRWTPTEATKSISTPEDLSKVAEAMYLTKFASMRPNERSAFAAEFVAASDDGRELPAAIMDYAPKAVIGPKLRDALNQREHLAKEAGLVELSTFQKLSSTVAELQPKEAIALLEQYDQLTGIAGRYKEGLCDPYKAVYGGFPPALALRKTAEAAVLDGMPKAGGSRFEYTAWLEDNYPRNTSRYQLFKQACRTAFMQDALKSIDPTLADAVNTY